MSYGRTVKVALSYDAAVERVKEALKAQGFGVLSEIDIAATLREKVGSTMEPYLILGACNPQLASRALEIEPDIGLLLPCNVVVRVAEGLTLVQALDPQVIVQVPGNDRLQPVAQEAGDRLQAALDSLA